MSHILRPVNLHVSWFLGSKGRLNPPIFTTNFSSHWLTTRKGSFHFHLPLESWEENRSLASKENWWIGSFLSKLGFHTFPGSPPCSSWPFQDLCSWSGSTRSSKLRPDAKSLALWICVGETVGRRKWPSRRKKNQAGHQELQTSKLKKHLVAQFWESGFENPNYASS